MTQAGDDAEWLKALPQDTWDAMLRRAVYAQAGWSGQEVETWSRAFYAVGGQIIIPALDALAVAVDGYVKQAIDHLVEAYRAKELD